MRNIIGNVLNFIGNVLIALAAFIKFLRNTLFLVIMAGIVLGIFAITMIALMELMGHLSSSVNYPIVVLGKWYWCLIVLVLGGSTMGLGISKIIDEEKKSKKEMEDIREKNYIYK